MWSGNVAFGLVHIPVKMYAATEDRDVKFHQVHIADGGRIKYQRQCQTCEQTVTYAEIGKGYEDETGRRVIVSEEELDGLQVPHGRDLEIIEFAPADQIDPLNFDKAYFLEPATGASKPYVLLRRALQETDRTAVVLMTMRKRTRLGLLRVRDDVLVLQTMLWPDEVRVPEFEGIADDDITVRPQELAMAGSLVESLSADFDASGLHRRVPPGRARPRHAEARRRGRDPAQQPGRGRRLRDGHRPHGRPAGVRAPHPGSPSGERRRRARVRRRRGLSSQPSPPPAAATAAGPPRPSRSIRISRPSMVGDPDQPSRATR